MCLGAQFGGDRPQRRRVRQLVVAHHARHFFNQVFFDLQVKTESRRHHGQDTLGLGDIEPESAQGVKTLRLGQRHANNFCGARHPQLHRCGHRHVGLLVIDRAARGVGRAANVHNQPREVLNMLHRGRRVHAALKAVTRIGRKVKPA